MEVPTWATKEDKYLKFWPDAVGVMASVTAITEDHVLSIALFPADLATKIEIIYAHSALRYWLTTILFLQRVPEIQTFSSKPPPQPFVETGSPMAHLRQALTSQVHLTGSLGYMATKGKIRLLFYFAGLDKLPKKLLQSVNKLVQLLPGTVEAPPIWLMHWFWQQHRIIEWTLVKAGGRFGQEGLFSFNRNLRIRPEWRPAPAAALPTLGPEKGQEEVTPMGGVAKTHQRHLTALPEHPPHCSQAGIQLQTERCAISQVPVSEASRYGLSNATVLISDSTNIKWGDAGTKYAMESTGVFTTTEKIRVQVKQAAHFTFCCPSMFVTGLNYKKSKVYQGWASRHNGIKKMVKQASEGILAYTEHWVVTYDLNCNTHASNFDAVCRKNKIEKGKQQQYRKKEEKVCLSVCLSVFWSSSEDPLKRTHGVLEREREKETKGIKHRIQKEAMTTAAWEERGSGPEQPSGTLFSNEKFLTNYERVKRLLRNEQGWKLLQQKFTFKK
ncbi:hypothetical protein U0070_004106 [Myodes glareolus]|uniref:glyceraldehyde-3-phosphate dehydrogenase (phosphorylating) n=1 Tax=Myodes glareolus TaxID=447135 RepID=A0AAW0K9K5_MYOGA